MPHIQAHPLHAVVWGVGLPLTILKRKSRTFSVGSYDFLPNWCHFSIQSFSPFLPPFSTRFNTPVWKFWCIHLVLWNENVVLNFHNIVERGWGLAGRSNIHRQQVTLLGVFVFPVVLVAVISMWMCGEWEASSGRTEGNVATQWMTTKPWNKHQIFIEQFYSDVGLCKTSLTIRWRC